MKIHSKLLLTAVAASVAGAASAYDAAADFSLASNPNGVWSYGYATSLTGSMTLDTQTATLGALSAWQGGLASDGNPSVIKNGSNAVVAVGTVTWLANQMIMHPGPGGQYAVVRFTAPSTGLYNVGAAFIGQDSTSTDVHVVKNDLLSIFDGAINGYGNAASFSPLAPIALVGGDTLDLRVGYGSNGTFYNDSTGANLSVQAVPEPAPMAALALGALGLLRRRRTR